MLRRDPGLNVDIGEQSPARPILAPIPIPQIILSTQRNHGINIKTSAPSADFFSSLLERWTFIESVSGGGEVVLTFFGFEEIADLADRLPEGVDGADGHGA